MNLIVSALARLAITAMALGATAAQAAEVKLIASAAMKEILGELLPLFEKATGHAVKATWSGTEAATKRLREGETFDVVLISGANIDRLMTEGRIVAGSRADVARSGIGVAVRAGLPKPDISSGEAVKKAVLAAKTRRLFLGPERLLPRRSLQTLGHLRGDSEQGHPDPVRRAGRRGRGARRSRARLPASERAAARQGHRLSRPAAARDPARDAIFRGPARDSGGARSGRGAGEIPYPARGCSDPSRGRHGAGVISAASSDRRAA